MLTFASAFTSNFYTDAENGYRTHSFFSFFLNFWRTWVLFVGPLIPLFWTSGDVSSGFQSQSGFCLIRTWRRRTSNVTHSLRFISGATTADLLAASMATEPISSTYLRRHWWELNGRPLAPWVNAFFVFPSCYYYIHYFEKHKYKDWHSCFFPIWVVNLAKLDGLD